MQDIAVWAYGDDSWWLNKWAVYMLFLNQDWTVKNYKKITNTDLWWVLEEDWMFGGSITSLQDFDRNWFVDIAVWAYGENNDWIEKGSVYLLFLWENWKVINYKKISNLTGDFEWQIGNLDNFWFSLWLLKDKDWDDNFELVVWVPKDDDWWTNRWAIYILFLDRN